MIFDECYDLYRSNKNSEEILLLKYVIKRKRKSPIPRQRWRRAHLVPLAISENSFISEFGVSPPLFDYLFQVLRESLEVDEMKSQAANPNSSILGPDARLAAALIELRGGRRIETMRTLGIAKSTAYENFKRVIRAINNHPLLQIQCDMSVDAQKERAAGFEALSTHKTFQFCTGAVDGLALTTIAPSRKKFRNQAQFHSGSKKKNCVNMQGYVWVRVKVYFLKKILKKKNSLNIFFFFKYFFKHFFIF